MSTPSFGEKVYAFTEENALVSAPATVVVGVSGGADSMALLHVLHSWVDKSLDLIAVHIHHGLRGEEADLDEALVRSYCAQKDIEYVCEHIDVRAKAKELGIGEEEAGRYARYETFERIRQERGAMYIATAHHADDTIETVLMHILRGSGIGGLCGIPAKRGAVIRPLLSCDRAEIEAYCKEQAIPYRIDGTNCDLSYTRNRVRHHVLPVLKEINPSIGKALLRLRDAAAQDESYFEEVACSVLAEARLTDETLDRSVLLQQASAARARVWKKWFMQIGCHSYAQSHIDSLERALVANEGTVLLSDGVRVCVSAGRVTCFTDNNASEPMPRMTVDVLPFRFVLNGHEHALYCFSREELKSLQNVHKKFFKSVVDYDKIRGSLMIRGREDGDHFHPNGRRVGKTLKNIFQELHIPTYDRDAVALLCDEEGIVLLPGVACDKRVATDVSTKHFLVWTTDNEPS